MALTNNAFERPPTSPSADNRIVVAAPLNAAFAACRLEGRIGYSQSVSPTVLRVRGYRFYFFSREEPRSHVHVQHASGEAKFRLEPGVELAADYGLGRTRINAARKIIEEHRDEIRAAWARHFGS